MAPPMSAGSTRELVRSPDELLPLIRRELAQGTAHYREAGRLLLEAKKPLPHGAFKRWVQDHCAVSYRQASNYMRMAAKDETRFTWEVNVKRSRSAYTGPVIPPPDDLAGALLAKLDTWGIPGQRIKRWAGGYLVELEACPWASEHTTGSRGAAVMIHASGALDFTCLHAHCAGRTWRDFRARMESPR
jgi:hypothetical protein